MFENEVLKRFNPFKDKDLYVAAYLGMDKDL